MTLIALYLTAYVGTGREPYRPEVAWVRAGIWSTVCWLGSVTSGSFERLVTEPDASANGRGSTAWLALAAAAAATLLGGRWVLWRRAFGHGDRPAQPGVSAAFGVVWGVCTGQWIVVIFDAVAGLGVPGSAQWIVTSVASIAWVTGFHHWFWHPVVLPERPDPAAGRAAWLLGDVPAIAITCAFLVFTEDRMSTVALFTMAFVPQAFAIRMPAPWNRAPA
ncbi:MAG: hypothetical protein V9E99_16320 [Microthrixaceae bacterium]|jgi:hypothetical protein|nr:hypothetical protein [Microthrixaceae bacterium]HMT23492.1 hypothetical protein [Microthrixaceae bacterium]